MIRYDRTEFYKNYKRNRCYVYTAEDSRQVCGFYIVLLKNIKNGLEQYWISDNGNLECRVFKGRENNIRGWFIDLSSSYFYEVEDFSNEEELLKIMEDTKEQIAMMRELEK